MSVGKAAVGAGKVLIDQYKDGFFDWMERKIKETPKLKKLRDEWIKRDWHKAGEKYLASLKEYHSQFTVYGIEGNVSLSELGTDVFLRDQPEFRQHRGDTDSKRISGLRLVFNDQRGQKLLLWGTPGAGKTTFLKQVVQAAIDKTDKIPLFITIAEWVATCPITYKGLLSYVAQQFKKCGFDGAEIFVDFLIESGTALLLFDGLDEISSEDRRQAHLLLSNLNQSKSQVVITCRTSTYENRWPSPFWEAELAPWDEERIKNFVTKRLATTETINTFFETLDDEKFQSLTNLWDNPLLLSLLCLVFDPATGFPEDPGKVYQQATRHLIAKLDQHKEKPVSRTPLPGNLTVTQLETLYAYLAYHTFEQNEIYFNEVDLEKRLSLALQTTLSSEKAQSIDIIKLLPQLVSQHGILARRGYTTYAFSHLTFQEYYTAKYISDNMEEGTLESLSAHINDLQWNEVFKLTASLITEATPLFRNMQIAAQRIIESSHKLLEIQIWVKQRAKHIPLYKENAKRSFYWNLTESLATRLYKTLHRNPISPLPDLSSPHYFNTVRARSTRVFERDRILAFEFDRIIQQTRFKFSVIDELIDLELDPSFDLLFDQLNMRDLPIHMKESLEKFIFDQNTSFLFLLVNIFALLPEWAQSKKRVAEFQTFFTSWDKLPGNIQNTRNIIAFPQYQSTGEEWQIFRNSIQKRIEYILDIDISVTLNLDDIELEYLSEYLQAFQLFWDCLKIAKVENRQAVEDMMFKAPDDAE